MKDIKGKYVINVTSYLSYDKTSFPLVEDGPVQNLSVKIVPFTLLLGRSCPRAPVRPTSKTNCQSDHG